MISANTNLAGDVAALEHYPQTAVPRTTTELRRHPWQPGPEQNLRLWPD
jgi:hypothetical protein